MKHLFIILLIEIFFPSNAEARIHRSSHARTEFKHLHPCPANGKVSGKCHGYVIDHRQALCVGGADAPENMRWMDKESAEAKDRWECMPEWETKLRECEANGCFVN